MLTLQQKESAYAVFHAWVWKDNLEKSIRKEGHAVLSTNSMQRFATVGSRSAANSEADVLEEKGYEPLIVRDADNKYGVIGFRQK